MKLTACWSSMSTKPALRYGVLLALVTVSLTTCSFAAALQTAKMPESLQVPEGFASKDNWNGSPMTPLEFTLDDQIHTQTEISVSNMVSKHTSSVGAVGFAIRRPGWVLCREEGQQLSQLSAAHPSIFEDFGIFGMVKEINVDDAGLLEFHKKYFPHDIYLDASQQFYKTLGSRKITTLRTWNPLRLWRGYQDMKERITRKNLEGNLIGEGIIQGGIVIFDRHGDPRAVYQEQIGNEIPEESILQALKALQEEYKQTSDGASAEL